MATFTGDAVKARLVYSDDFNRSGSGIGTSSDGTVYTTVDSSGDESTDGSALIVPAGGFGEFTGYAMPRIGIVQFDFLTSSDIDNDFPFWELDVGDGDHYIWLEVFGNGGEYEADVNGDATVDFIPDPSTWYTVKGFFDLDDVQDRRIKVWKVGDPEPDWQDQQPGFVRNFHGPYELQLFADGEDMAIDNTAIWTVDPKTVVSETFTTDAVRKMTVGNGQTTAPTFVNEAHAQATSTTVTVNKPTGVTTGDSMYALILGFDPFLTAPSGWTRILPFQSTGGAYLHVFTKVAGGSEPSNYAFVQSSSSVIIGAISAWRDVGPPTTQLTIVTGGFSTSQTAPAVTTQVRDAILIHAFAALQTSGGGMQWTGTPSGMTVLENLHQASGLSEIALLSAYQVFPTPGAAGTKTAVANHAIIPSILTLVLTSPGRWVTADAYLAAGGGTTVTSSFTANAQLTARRQAAFTIDAIFAGGRTRHDRTDLHRDTQNDLTVTLVQAVGAAAQGSSLHDALVELDNRITTRENTGA